VVQKSEDRPTSTESRLGDGTATRAGQSGMAVTRENDNVDDKLIEKKEEKNSVAVGSFDNVSSAFIMNSSAFIAFKRPFHISV